MMEETKELTRDTKRFIGQLCNAGLSTEQVAYQVYKLNLAVMENDIKRVENMLVAGHWTELAMKEMKMDRESLWDDLMAQSTRAER